MKRWTLAVCAVWALLQFAHTAFASSVFNTDNGHFHRNCPPGMMLTATDGTGVAQDMATVLKQYGGGTGTVYWVDQKSPNASDANDGKSQATPWLTIGHAAATLTPGDAVIVRAGTYRESISPKSGTAQNPISFAAYTGEDVVVTGSELFKNWTYDAASNSYWIPWNTSLPVGTDSSGHMTPRVLRGELVAISGPGLNTALYPVDSTTAPPVAGTLAPGQFYAQLSATDINTAARIYARFPGDVNPNAAGYTVECAVRQTTFAALGKSNLRVLGFHFTHAANVYQQPACAFGSACLIEENIFDWNNASGISLSSNSTFRGNASNNNGNIGYVGTASNSLIEFHQSNGNNWKHFGVDTGDSWGAGAGKIVNSTGTLMRYCEAGNNQAIGFWFDISCNTCTLQDSISYNNWESGVQMEISTNITIRNVIVYGTQVLPNFITKSGQRIYAGNGITVAATPGVTIEHCTIFGCADTGVYIDNDSRGPNSSERVCNNLMAFNGSEIHLYAADAATLATDQVDGNLYWHPATNTNPNVSPKTNGFCFELDIGTAATKANDLATWQSVAPGDTHAKLADPKLQAEPLQWVVNGNLADVTAGGWHIASSSPAIGMGVAPPVACPDDYDNDARPSSGADAGADQFALPLATLTATPATITQGSSTTLSWTANADFSTVVSIDQGVGVVAPASVFTPGDTAASGSVTVKPSTTTTYTLTVSNASGRRTAQAKVSVNIPPTVTTQPVSATVNAGGSATFAITASGTAPLTYQWTRNGANISGATASSYTTPPATAADNGASYRCSVSNVAGKVTSNGALLTVNSPPVITSDASASPQSAYVGQSIAFSVAASDQDNDGLTFTWTFGDGASATGTAVTHAYAAAGAYTATVTISDGKGGTASSSVTVQITALPPAVAINAGGAATGSFAADTNVTGGSRYATSAPIDVSAVTRPAPQAVYQTERYGNFTYTIGGFSPNLGYTVRLHFAEIYWNSAGRRVFNVSINQQPVLSNFDIFAAAGARYKALIREFTVSPDSNGQIVIVFSTIKDNAKISGIELIPNVVGSAPLAALGGAAAVSAETPLDLGSAPVGITLKLNLDAPTTDKTVRLQWIVQNRRALPPGVTVRNGLITGKPRKSGVFAFSVNIKSNFSVATNTYQISIGE